VDVGAACLTLPPLHSGDLSDLIVSGPELDTFGDGLTVTLKTAIYLNNTISGEPELMAVAGLEYKYKDFVSIMTKAINDADKHFHCNTMDSDGTSQRCYLMDEVPSQHPSSDIDLHLDGLVPGGILGIAPRLPGLGCILQHPRHSLPASCVPWRKGLCPVCACCDVKRPHALIKHWYVQEPELAQALLEAGIIEQVQVEDPIGGVNSLSYEVIQRRQLSSLIP
jgi:hypothetical protein